MRVKFGDMIYLCTVIIHPENSKSLMVITITNKNFAIEMNTEEEANNCYISLLKKGYYDFTGCHDFHGKEIPKFL